MRSWLITGGVACGKTLVSQQVVKIAGRKAALFSADAAIQQAGQQPDIHAALVDTFGSHAVHANEINRGWLREHVLPIPDLRAKLEGILHPPALAALEEARAHAAHGGANLFLAEIPLHYETGATVSADFVIVVASSRSVQVRRMMETRGLDEPTVQKFLEAQWPIEAKVERADAVIWNDGSLAALEAQVLTLASPLLHA